jgi:hypothetical protein
MIEIVFTAAVKPFFKWENISFTISVYAVIISLLLSGRIHEHLKQIYSFLGV